VVLAEKFSKFTNMNLKDLEKQLQELVDKLSSITDIGEEMLYNDVQEMEEEETNNNNENESYDDENNS